MANVCLVIPAHTDGKPGEPGEYLGIGYIASYLLSHGVSCEIIHADLFGLSAGQVIEILLRLRPRVIGFSVMQPAIRQTAMLLASLAELRAQATANHTFITVVGGHYPTIAPEKVLALLPGVDYLLRGDAEETFYQLVTGVLSGTDIRGTPGLVYRTPDGSLVVNPPHAPAPLDSLPFPDRRFLNLVLAKGGHATVSSSRGCAWNCYFCSNRAYGASISGPKWRSRSAANVIAEISDLKNRYGISEFLFNDDDFIGPGRRGRERIQEFARQLSDAGLGIKFSIFCRADQVDEDSVQRLKECGLQLVWLGIEAFDDELLKRFNKRLSVDRYLMAIECIERNGIQFKIGFIMFHPFASLHQIRRNLKWLQCIYRRQPNAVSYRHLLSRLRLYDAIPIEPVVKQEGRFVPNHPLVGYNSYKMDVEVHRLYAAAAALYRDLFHPVLKRLDALEIPGQADRGAATPVRALRAGLFDLFLRAFEKLCFGLSEQDSADLLSEESTALKQLGLQAEELAQGHCTEEPEAWYLHPLWITSCLYDVRSSRFMPMDSGERTPARATRSTTAWPSMPWGHSSA